MKNERGSTSSREKVRFCKTSLSYASWTSGKIHGNSERSLIILWTIAYSLIWSCQHSSLSPELILTLAVLLNLLLDPVGGHSVLDIPGVVHQSVFSSDHHFLGSFVGCLDETFRATEFFVPFLGQSNLSLNGGLLVAAENQGTRSVSKETKRRLDEGNNTMVNRWAKSGKTIMSGQYGVGGFALKMCHLDTGNTGKQC